MNRCKCFLMVFAIVSFCLFFSVIGSHAGTPPVCDGVEADCLEAVNPHGNVVPPAGSTTLPGPMGGQNEDGFYELLGTGESVQLFVVDQGSGTVFGPFMDEDVIKYTEDPDAIPSITPMGSTEGQAGAIEAHIKGTGDPAVEAVDACGNVSDTVSCLVPPLPK
jgi:hypothetical protein